MEVSGKPKLLEYFLNTVSWTAPAFRPWSWSQWQVMTSERDTSALHTPQYSVQTEQDVCLVGVSFPHSYLHSDYPYGSASSLSYVLMIDVAHASTQLH